MLWQESPAERPTLFFPLDGLALLPFFPGLSLASLSSLRSNGTSSSTPKMTQVTFHCVFVPMLIPSFLKRDVPSISLSLPYRLLVPHGKGLCFTHLRNLGLSDIE